MRDRYTMLVSIDFCACEIVEGDVEYRAESIVEQMKGIGAVEDARLIGKICEVGESD